MLGRNIIKRVGGGFGNVLRGSLRKPRFPALGRIKKTTQLTSTYPDFTEHLSGQNPSDRVKIYSVKRLAETQAKSPSPLTGYGFAGVLMSRVSPTTTTSHDLTDLDAKSIVSPEPTEPATALPLTPDAKQDSTRSQAPTLTPSQPPAIKDGGGNKLATVLSVLEPDDDLMIQYPDHTPITITAIKPRSTVTKRTEPEVSDAKSSFVEGRIEYFEALIRGDNKGSGVAHTGKEWRRRVAKKQQEQPAVDSNRKDDSPDNKQVATSTKGKATKKNKTSLTLPYHLLTGRWLALTANPANQHPTSILKITHLEVIEVPSTEQLRAQQLAASATQAREGSKHLPDWVTLSKIDDEKSNDKFVAHILARKSQRDLRLFDAVVVADKKLTEFKEDGHGHDGGDGGKPPKGSGRQVDDEEMAPAAALQRLDLSLGEEPESKSDRNKNRDDHELLKIIPEAEADKKEGEKPKGKQPGHMNSQPPKIDLAKLCRQEHMMRLTLRGVEKESVGTIQQTHKSSGVYNCLSKDVEVSGSGRRIIQDTTLIADLDNGTYQVHSKTTISKASSEEIANAIKKSVEGKSAGNITTFKLTISDTKKQKVEELLNQNILETKILFNFSVQDTDGPFIVTAQQLTKQQLEHFTTPATATEKQKVNIELVKNEAAKLAGQQPTTLQIRGITPPSENYYYQSAVQSAQTFQYSKYATSSQRRDRVPFGGSNLDSAKDYQQPEPVVRRRNGFKQS